MSRCADSMWTREPSSSATVASNSSPWPGRIATVDLSLCSPGHHVGLVTGAEHCGVGRVARGGLHDAGDGPEVPAQRRQVMRVELFAEYLRHHVEEQAHRVGNCTGHSYRPMPRERLSQLGHCVVFVGQRAVPCRALRDEPHPDDALLGCLRQGRPGGRSASGSEKPPTSLTASVTPSNSSGWLSTIAVRAHAPAGFLVGEEREHDGRCGRRPVRSRSRTHGQDHRVHVLHVDRAAAPHAAVGHLGRERVVRPVLRLRRHDVEVSVQRATRRSSLGRCPSMRATTVVRPGADSYERGSSPTSASRAATYSAAARSPGPLAVAVVGRVDPDEVSAEVDDLGSGCVMRPSCRAGIASAPGSGRGPARLLALPAALGD